MRSHKDAHARSVIRGKTASKSPDSIPTPGKYQAHVASRRHAPNPSRSPELQEAERNARPADGESVDGGLGPAVEREFRQEAELRPGHRRTSTPPAGHVWQPRSGRGFGARRCRPRSRPL
jgi:hypothetical protein